ncbi:MAG TPA: DoxX family protein [Candidatus Baltobacteraceae bacterium]|nr:DoxX family protein [Candidatus Baltobacteraceae bacterium]
MVYVITMEAIMESSLGLQSARPRAAVPVARVLYVLAVLFMLFDVFGKFTLPAAVVDAFHRQGMPIALAPVIGGLLLALVILYVIPRTSVLGAVLLTGYLGGACAINMRAEFSAFETLFPVLFGVIVWIPIYLLNERVRALIPIRR